MLYIIFRLLAVAASIARSPRADSIFDFIFMSIFLLTDRPIWSKMNLPILFLTTSIGILPLATIPTSISIFSSLSVVPKSDATSSLSALAMMDDSSDATFTPAYAMISF